MSNLEMATEYVSSGMGMGRDLGNEHGLTEAEWIDYITEELESGDGDLRFDVQPFAVYADMINAGLITNING